MWNYNIINLILLLFLLHHHGFSSSSSSIDFFCRFVNGKSIGSLDDNQSQNPELVDELIRA